MMDKPLSKANGPWWYEYQMCGDCRKRAVSHPTTTEYMMDGEVHYSYCERDFLEVDEAFGTNPKDYVQFDKKGHYVLPYEAVNFSGPESILVAIEDRSLEWEDVAKASALDDLSHWSDKDPKVATSAKRWWYLDKNQVLRYGDYHTNGKPQDKGNPMDLVVPPPQQRSAYVESIAGFLAIEVLNLELTDKYAKRLLNVYYDKQGYLRCGGIRFTSDNATGIVWAQCVQPSCTVNQGGVHQPRTMSIKPAEATRQGMEDFVLSVIRHGNNHAATWYTTRDTYYKVHEYGCRLNCNPQKFYCFGRGEPKPVEPQLAESASADESTTKELEALVDFIYEHRGICKDNRCSCTTRLNEAGMALADSLWQDSMYEQAANQHLYSSAS